MAGERAGAAPRLDALHLGGDPDAAVAAPADVERRDADRVARDVERVAAVWGGGYWAGRGEEGFEGGGPQREQERWVCATGVGHAQERERGGSGASCYVCGVVVCCVCVFQYPSDNKRSLRPHA